jgi:hypothetical protein
VLVATNNQNNTTMSEKSKVIQGEEIFDISLIAAARPYK